jgi:predicted nucleotidyltransferase
MTKKHAETRDLWVRRLQAFLPGFLAAQAVLGRFVARADVVLHGSTTFGVDDASSDLDLWFVLPAQDLDVLNAVSQTAFFEFELEGKLGHLNALAAESLAHCVGHADLPVIYELRRAEVLLANVGAAADLVRDARKPMPRAVRDAFFFHHYVDMRACHKSCRGPMARREALAVLLSLGQTLANALRAAVVLDGEPYPYDKWLRSAASRTATGRLLMPDVEGVLDDLAAGVLRFAGTDAEHPLNRRLWSIREKLVAAARAKGIDEPWLDQWWLHMDRARSAVLDIRWE